VLWLHQFDLVLGLVVEGQPVIAVIGKNRMDSRQDKALSSRLEAHPNGPDFVQLN
jgi:hypothetical protein